MSHYNDIQIQFMTKKIEDLNAKGAGISPEAFFTRMETMMDFSDTCRQYNMKPKTLESFTEFATQLLSENVIPFVVANNMEGKTPKGVGDDFEELMGYAFNCMPKEIQQDFEGKNPLDIPKYEKFVKTAFLESRNSIYPIFNATVKTEGDPSLNLAEALNNYVNDMKDTMNHAKQGEGMDRWDDLKERSDQNISLISTRYMKVREEYNSLGFFGKWFTIKGYTLRGCMNNVKETMSEFTKYAGGRDGASISEYIHLAAKLSDEMDQKMTESIASFNTRKQIVITEEELENGTASEILTEDSPEDLELAERLVNKMNKDKNEAEPEEMEQPSNDAVN